MKTRTIAEVTIAALMFVSVLLSRPLLAQSMSPVFDHTTRHVRDLQKSGEFYDKVLQLKRIPDPFKDNNHIWYRIGPHEQLHVVGKAAEVPQQDKELHFAFHVASVDAFRAHLDKMQVKYSDFKGEDGKVTNRPDGVHQIYFQDPDGYWIEVNDNKF